MQMEVFWFSFQSSELFDLLAIALHSFLIKQEKEMNKELCDQFSEEVLFASSKDHLLMLGARSSRWPCVKIF